MILKLIFPYSSYAEHYLCAGEENGNVGPCPGDAGGPLTYYNSQADPPFYMLIGVLHGSVDHCVDQKKADAPAIFARVDHPEIFDFIKRTKLDLELCHLKGVVPILDDDKDWNETSTRMTIEDNTNIWHLPNIQDSPIEALEFKRIKMEFCDLSLTNFNKLASLWIHSCNGLRDLTKLLSGLESLTELKVDYNSNLNYAGKLPPNWNKLTTFRLIGDIQL